MYQECKTTTSNIIERLGNGKVTLPVKRLKEHLSSLKVDIVENSNIGKKSLRKKGLHLNPRGSGKLATKVMKKIKSLQQQQKKRYDAGSSQWS